jgi:16S rRNA (guanine966-N2)-methyltransferase
MRVVAGIAKGRELRLPKSRQTRPTTDKVRDAVFNVLGSAVDDASVVDLFAGSGAMAIEALSRGADTAELVESDREACDCIRQNLDLTGLGGHATVWAMPVQRALGLLGRRFDLIILDPPYQMPGIHGLMTTLGCGGLLGGDGMVVLEHSKRFQTEVKYGSLVRWQEKRYGDTAISFYEVMTES